MTTKMVKLVLDDLDKQDVVIRANEKCDEKPGKERREFYEKIFELLHRYAGDDLDMHLIMLSDVMGAVTVMAGRQCEHGSCFVYDYIEDYVDVWRSRLPMLDVDQRGATRQ